MSNNLSGRSDRPLTFTEQARRAQILAAAVDLLAEGGFRAASLAAVATRIGVSKGVISYHFSGKDELLEQVVSSVLAGAAAFMTPRLEGVAGARAQLRAYIESNLDYLDRHRREARALSAVLTGLPPRPDGSPAYAESGQAAVAALTALLAAGQRSGELGPFDAEVVARLLRASIDAVTEVLRSDEQANVTAYRDQLLALFEPAVLP